MKGGAPGGGQHGEDETSAHGAVEGPKGGKGISRGRLRKSRLPFGIGATKPRHFREMGRIAWDNRGKLGYAWRILNDGVCDGCALGTSGLEDWTLDGTHLCLVRLNLLELNTMGPLDPGLLAQVAPLREKSSKALRRLGRLPFPMVWRAGTPGYVRVSWDEALAGIGGRLAATDPDRAGLFLTSRGLTNEVYYAAQKAWRAYGSPHVDNAARLCHSPSTAAMKATLGVAASTCSYKDWYDADLVVLFGSNPANDQPVALKYLYEAKKRGARVVVVNTYREPGLERYWIPSEADSALFGTAIADDFVSVHAGGDLAFAYAVQKELLARGAVDRGFIAARTEGWDDYVAHLEGFPAEELRARSGATADDVTRFAGALEGAGKAVFVWSMGLTQHAHGTDTVAAICSLALSRGYVGREGTGLMPIRGHSGVQGGAEMGAYATAFPGHPLNDEGADALEALWGFRPPAREGLDAAAMVDAAKDRRLDALYAVGGNFLETLPDPAGVAEGLGRVGLRVHQDIVLNSSMLVPPPAGGEAWLLPARTRYEHRGGVTETTTERRVIFSPYIPGHEVGEAREEWRILSEVVQATGVTHAPRFADAAAVRADIARTIPAYERIAELEKKGDQFQWGGPRLCEERFGTPSGKARFVTAEVPDRRLPKGQLHLATRRGKQFNSLVQKDVDDLTGAARDHVLLAASDMAELGLQDDARILVESAHGHFAGRALTAAMHPGNAQMHWPEANVLLPADRRDPGGRVPDYNVVVTLRAQP
ncbi:MAG: FdhF/YdeP family oxidoreductase [Myxococcota bacterium]